MVRLLPPLNALRAFESAARLGSFAGAAKELHVTPAAISHQVKGLEDHLGVALFHRHARGLDLTDAGRLYLPELTQGFEDLARAGERLTDGGLGGRLVISILPSFCAGWLAPRLPGFQARWPDIDLELLSQPGNADFAGGEADMGLRYGTGNYPGLEVTKVLEEEVFPVCAPSLLNGSVPLRTMADLTGHTLLHDPAAMPDEIWSQWPTWLDFAGVEIPGGPEAVLEQGYGFTDTTAMIEACLAGLGVGLGRSALVEVHLRNGRLVRPFPVSHAADFSYWAAVPPENRDNPRVIAFLEWILEVAALEAKKG